jgi:2,4-dienoyl-CoA reductase-like NADH-dependent reductase (Old Yellow Enzyme family)
LAHSDPPKGKPRGTDHPLLETYRPFVKSTKLVLNGGVTPEEGASLILSGQIDAVAIGYNFITHPDYVKRVLHGKPLDNAPDFIHLQWGKDGKDFTVGYTDYPIAVY